MKERAWITMLSIVVIGYTGFGCTTSDLIQNSDTKAQVTFDDCDLVSVVDFGVAHIYDVSVHQEAIIAPKQETVEGMLQEVSNVSFEASRNGFGFNAKVNNRNPRDAL